MSQRTPEPLEDPPPNAPAPDPADVGKPAANPSEPAGGDPSWAEALLEAEGPVLQMIGSGRPSGEVLEALCRMAEALCPGLVGSILQLDADGRHLRIIAAPSLPRSAGEPPAMVPVGPAGGVCGAAAQSGEPVACEDLADNASHDGRASRGLRACLAIPFRSAEGAVLGIFASYLREPRRPTPRERRVASRAAMLAAIAVERGRAEAALREGEQRYRSLVTATAAIVWTTPASGEFEVEQPGWSAFTGQRFDQLRGWGWLDAVHPDDRDATTAVWRGAVENRAIYRVEHRLRRADGAYRHMSVRAVPILGDDGAVREWVGVHNDVTERRAAEAALRASEERFRHLADAMPQIVWMARPDHSIEFYNQRWFEFTGLSPEESYRPEGWRAAVHPDDIERIVAAGALTQGDGTPFEAEYRLRDRRGGYRWHLGRAVPVLDAAGRVVRRLGTATDIDDRRRAEQDARFLAEAGATLGALTDEAGALERVARLAVPHFADWCAVDLIGDDGELLRVAMAHADASKTRLGDDLHRRYPTRPETPGGIAHVLRTGEPVLVPEITDAVLAAVAQDEDHLGLLRGLGLRSYLCVPLLGRAGPLGTIAFVAAESGRRYGPDDLRLAEDLARRAAIAVENARLYDALRTADRRKDDFLATLAHELRNPLAPIRNALHLMAHPDPEGRGHENERAMAERQVVHLSRLVDDLLDVARITRGKIELRRRHVELREAVANAVEAVRPALAERGHALAVANPADRLFVHADPTRLEQVLDNLLTNAIKYTEPNGRIALEVRRDGDEAVILVRDSGIGIPGEKLPQVFEMFAQVDGRTTRSQGGLGIGLGLVKRLVELHGGSVAARSAGPGAGSEFVVRLPALAEAPPPATVGTRDGDRPSLSRRRILIVDDNVDAAVSLAKLLSRFHGQEVRVAHDGRASLAAAGAFRPEIVLLDLGMPGMDGFEVARRLRHRPDLDPLMLVALTGWGQEADRRRSLEAGFDHHLVKPVDPDALRALLAALP